MKCQIALLLVGFVALSSANGYNSQLRKTLQQIPVPKNYQHRVAAPAHHRGAGAPGSDFGAGAPGSDFGAGAQGSDFGAGAQGSDFGAGAQGAHSVDEVDIELHQQQPVQVLYKAPTRVVERQPIRIVNNPSPSSYNRGSEDAAPPPPQQRRGAQVTVKKPVVRSDEELALQEEEFHHAAKNAKYSFASAVDDGIQDQSHIRQETRDGLKVTGTYAYSDGYFKRTVNYEADENGYRVVDESVEPLGEDGPQIDLVNGKAEVHTQIGGVDTQYSVSADELAYNTKRANEFSTKKEQ